MRLRSVAAASARSAPAGRSGGGVVGRAAGRSAGTGADGASGAALGAASFVFGLTMGNIFMLQPLLVAEYFGVGSFASVLGSLQLVTQLASGLGPVALGFAFERVGGYERPLEALAGIAVAAALVLSRVRPPPGGRR